MVAFGDSAANPPEVNYYTLMAGDHAASATAAAAAHQVLADALAAEMALMGANTAATATCGWQGVGGTSMVLSAAQLMEIMSLAVAWLQQGSLQAAEIVQAYHTAAQTMIPGPVCIPTASTQAGLVATNIIGQNTPAIIALDTQYLGGYLADRTRRSWPSTRPSVSAALALLATPPPFAPDRRQSRRAAGRGGAGRRTGGRQRAAGRASRT